MYLSFELTFSKSVHTQNVEIYLPDNARALEASMLFSSSLKDLSQSVPLKKVENHSPLEEGRDGKVVVLDPVYTASRNGRPHQHSFPCLC